MSPAPTYAELVALCHELLDLVPKDDRADEGEPWQSEERAELLERAEDVLACAEAAIEEERRSQ